MSTSTTGPTEPQGSEPSSKPEPLCLCGHAWWAHEGACETCKCQRYEADAPPEDRLQSALNAASEMKEALPLSRRPPYAVTYATRSRDFQVLTPGDCSVSVVDGALVIRHIEPVTGVTAVQPYYTKEG